MSEVSLARRRYREGACASRPGTSTPSSSACRGCCPGSTSAGPTSSACRRPSSPTTRSRELLGDELARPRLRGRGPRRADLERRRDPLARRAGGRRRRARRAAPGFPHPEARAVSATCGGIRVVSVYVPNGRAPGSDHYAYKLAWLARAARVVAAGPRADRRLRRHEHRADRRRRVRPRRLRRPDARDAARARGAGRAAGARPARRRARPLARRAGLHLLGLPGRNVPPGPRDADRPRAGRRRRWRSASRRRGSTARRARAAARATTRRSSSTSTRRPTATSGRSCRRRRARCASAARRSCRRRLAQSRLRSRSRDGWTRLGSPGIFG